MQRGSRFWKIGVLCLPILFLCACSTQSDAEANTSSETQPARVRVMTVQPEAVTVYDELPGRVSAFRTAEIRAQVSGIILKKLFQEGAAVEAGAPLFQIDPAPFAADADAAAAVLARTQAEQLNAQLKFDRAKLLSSRQAMSEEAFDNATAALEQAKASVAEARANLTRRKLELSNATIRSPIGGIIGQSFMSEGGLASPSASSPLAVVRQIDRVYVDVRQSSMNLERLRETTARAGKQNPDDLPVTIMTVTGKSYSHRGKVLFSDISVDSATGSLGIRIVVPNPEGQLLPGMFIRALVPREVYSAALLVPQEAVTRDLAGRPELLIVAADKTGVRRTVELGPLVNGRYVVSSGLEPGETIVVLGQERVRSGQPLQTIASQGAPEKQG